MEADIDRARPLLRAGRDATGEPLSLTAWVAACVARAVEDNPTVHAHRWGRGTDRQGVLRVTPSAAHRIVTRRSGAATVE